MALDEWRVDKNQFPYNASLRDQALFVLRYAILAPSTHNSQPWRYRITDTGIQAYVDPDVYTIVHGDLTKRDLYISMGAFLENLFTAAEIFGMKPNVQLALGTEKNLIAKVGLTISAGRNSERDYMLNAIIQRTNARGFFEKDTITDTVREEIKALPHDVAIQLDLFEDETRRKRFAELTAEGLRIAYRNPDFRREVAAWTFHNWSRTRQGLVGYALRMPLLLSFFLPTIIRHWDIGPFLAKKNFQSVGSAPLIGVFSANEENPQVWIKLGQYFERISLALVARGYYTSVFVASIEMGELWKEIQKILGHQRRPQFLFCAGKMLDVPKHAPRHVVGTKLIT